MAVINLQFSTNHTLPKAVNLPIPQSSRFHCRGLLTGHPRQNHAAVKLRPKGGLNHTPIRAAKSNDIHPLSPLEALADEFYASLNAKKLNTLRGLVSDDCVFQDSAFSKPFQGKEMHHFFKKLTEAMGKDVKFIIDEIYESGSSSVAVRWHLEWQKYHIPCASGCSLYECTEQKEKLVIK